MNEEEQEKRKIIIEVTPEMANWMHPQTEERKKIIEDRTKELKERIQNRRNNKELNDEQ